jgi:hypothetical protein
MSNPLQFTATMLKNESEQARPRDLKQMKFHGV